MKHGARRSSKRSRPVKSAPTAVAANNLRLEVALKHHRAGDLALAEGHYRQILADEPRHPRALHLLGLIAFQNGDPEHALELIRQAIGQDPRDAIFHCNLGMVLRRMDRLEEALESVDRAAALDGRELKPVLERGQVLYALRRPAEARVVFESVLSRDPHNALAHLGIAFAALAQGDFERGWAEFEYRQSYAEYGLHERSFAQPVWDGLPFADRTILLHAEQGLGDTLHFVRFAPLVKALGGRVVLECQPELRSVLEGAPGVDQLIATGEAAPPFDLHAPLMSLPWLLGIRLATIPVETPYLPVAARRAAAPDRPRLASDGRLKVGLVWAGSEIHANDHQRSMTLATLAPLGQVPGVALFALQKGPASDQTALPPPGMVLTDLGPGLHDFGATAQVLSQLDLVITVDTAIAHLAGALGRPVWLLLSFAPDFRWLLDRDDTPWYPSMRLFRQRQRADWSAVIDDVTAALTQLSTPSEPRSVAPTATGVVVALPVGGNIGWGVCGRNIAAELAKLTPVDLVSSQDDYAAQCTPRPLLQAITDNSDFSAFRPNVRSTSRTVGYTFFEENILSAAAVQNAAQQYDHIVTGSTWCEDVLRRSGLTAVSTILQGIDPLVFHPATASTRQFGDRFVVFSGGKLEFRKGQDLVIRAFKVLQDRHRDVLLVNAWFNPWAFSVDTMAASPYIDFQRTSIDHVEFVSQLLVANGIDLAGVVTLPSQAHGSMPEVYWATDVGLFPNRCEGGTNLVLMEYMAAGRPAIAAYTSGQCDIVTEQNALLIQQMAPLLMNDDDRPIALWDDPNLEETIERLEWAYQHRADLEPLAQRAGRDLAALTWARTAAAFHALLEPRPKH